MSADVLVERFAAIAHESWAGWIPWMIDKWNDTHASGETFRDRWLRQASTLYDQLSEAEKESDRTEARKYVAAIAMACPTCGQDMVATVCARCALTTAEERDAARAEVARLTAALQKIAEDNRIAHPERPDFWVSTNTAPGHRRCREIARDALKGVPDAAT